MTVAKQMWGTHVGSAAQTKQDRQRTPQRWRPAYGHFVRFLCDDLLGRQAVTGMHPVQRRIPKVVGSNLSADVSIPTGNDFKQVGNV